MRTCQLTIGRLVSHPCGRKTSATCPKCGRAVCDRHLAIAGDTLCAQCAGLYVPPAAPIRVSEEEMFAFSSAEIAAFDQPLAAQAAVRVAQVDDS